MAIETVAASAGAAAIAAAPGTRVDRLVRYGTDAEGMAQEFALSVIRGASDGPVVAFTAGIHGDEYEGPAALWRLADAIDPAALRGTLLIVPIANASAFAAGTRTSPVDGENLARIFPGNAEGTLSHRLAAALMDVVVAPADILIDSHSGGVRMAFVPVAGFYENGAIATDVSARSLQVARQMGLEHLWLLPQTRGVLSFEAARRGVAVCGAEIGGRGNCLPEDAENYLGAYLSVLAHQGMIDARHKRAERSACLVGDWGISPEAGYLETIVAPGERVREGQVVARLRDAHGRVTREFSAGFDGFVMGVRHLNSVAAGELAVCVVRETTR
jgi:predicted deacylase